MLSHAITLGVIHGLWSAVGVIFLTLRSGKNDAESYRQAFHRSLARGILLGLLPGLYMARTFGVETKILTVYCIMVAPLLLLEILKKR